MSNTIRDLISWSQLPKQSLPNLPTPLQYYHSLKVVTSTKALLPWQRHQIDYFLGVMAGVKLFIPLLPGEDHVALRPYWQDWPQEASARQCVHRGAQGGDLATKPLLRDQGCQA